MSHRRCIFLAIILFCLALSGCVAPTSTPGETTADSLLQRDVQRFITAFERSHGSGKVVDTKVVSIKGSVATEQWYVQRGDTVVIYTPKFIPSPLGGTAIQWTTIPEQDQKKP